MNHEKDLEYAKDIYKLIRWYMLGLAERLPEIYSNISLTKDKECVSYYYHNTENNIDTVSRIFVYGERMVAQPSTSANIGKILYIRLDSDVLYHYTSKEDFPLYDDINSEAEYFQNSLLYTPEVNRDLLLVSYVKSRYKDLSKYKLLTLDLKILPKMLQICKHDLTFPKYKELVGE